MAPNSEEEGPRLTSVKDGIWNSHDDSNSKVSEGVAMLTRWVAVDCCFVRH
jgi:hypothetical protein